MILVDIQVPVLDQVYDFELNEEARAELLIEDILELIAGKEHLTCRNKEGMYLYAIGRERVLEAEKSLKQQGVCAGDRLILF